MPFVKPLPHWEAPGIEPPLSLRQNGWKAGVKPPDEYFNHLHSKAYEALKELQEYALHKDELDLSGLATDTELQAVEKIISTHLLNIENPHKVTKKQVGLEYVENYKIATQAEAETGSLNNKYMTPETTKQAVTKFTPKDVPGGFPVLDEKGKLKSDQLPNDTAIGIELLKITSLY
ncbi:hypothetical protein [Psychrobacillus lasiicapitis]|uniref:Uncharacterized protein n=1 Tax=Psychrobacillus lasiicapitis TaxID=1636719 RepID=A0A544TAU3_9BACI|nr:hypothetical protein [Psychrobacillus lasiicapitis]TQR14478.1 hypothetical protein FG382_08460 [Psychrobacillus lasiicapitis]GGA30991.1 hypothetical protein GCM10011384_20620 [Psychrobacillus lasiicapitis]